MIALASLDLTFFTSVVAVLAGIGALSGALGVVLARRTFQAVMGLLVTILCLSIEFIILGAPVIAFIQILVYAGAVVVLFIFVVMLLEMRKQDQDTLEGNPVPRGPGSWMWAAGSAVFLFIIGAWFVFKAAGSLNVQEVSSAGTALPGGAPEAVGNALFLDYLISFEAAAVFLLAAVIAAIYIAHPRGRDEKSTPGENNSDPGSENADPALAGKEAS